jgi:hypothetical protein
LKDVDRPCDPLVDDPPRLSDNADHDDDLDEEESRLSTRDFVLMLVCCVILALLVLIGITHGSGETIAPH